MDSTADLHANAHQQEAAAVMSPPSSRAATDAAAEFARPQPMPPPNSPETASTAEQLPEPPSFQTTLQKALDQLNHPGNLDLHSRLAAIENVLRTLVGGILQRR